MSLNQFPRRAFSGAATLQTFTGNGSTTTFTLSTAQFQNESFVYVDDVAQVPVTDYTINGTTLTFTSAPANSSEIIVRGFGVPTPLNTVSDASVTAAKLATGAIEAKLGYTPVSPTQLSTEVNNLIAGAPGALNTLDELAAALGDDANYAATITNALATKANTSSLGTLATVSPTGTPDSTKFLRGDNSWQVVAVTPTAVSDQNNTSTGYFDIPAGTTAQRPSSPASGMTRFNTTTGEPEWYDTAYSRWTTFAEHPIYFVDVTVVAGGGGGGGSSNSAGGGGGAGGLIHKTISLIPGSAISVIIGAGGAANETGNNSSFGSFFTAMGGGFGGNRFDGQDERRFGGNGGSGGGAAKNANCQSVGGSGTGSQGSNGGGAGSDGGTGGGGGGGAGRAGYMGFYTGSQEWAGDGGQGLYNVRWADVGVGSPTGWLAGGGGAGVNTGTAHHTGVGGAGGGASSVESGTPTGAVANTGGGGGGGVWQGGTGGAGGSGIVIISYPGAQRATGGTISNVAGITHHVFTSSGTFTA